jgi:manganese/zinc/iron transport system substrate-binding protein
MNQKLRPPAGQTARNSNKSGMLRRYLTVFLVTGGCLVNGGCDGNTAAENKTSDHSTQRQFNGPYPIRVVCTTGMVTDMLRNVGGEHVKVVGLMGPGVDPHLYKAVPADIEELSDADAIFYNGLHLEGRMADLFENLAKRKPTFAVTHALVEAKDKRLRTPPEFEGYYDPHVWHAPQIWANCVKYVADVLIKFDPAHRDDYARNRDAYLEQLTEADEYCREQLATLPAEQRVLVSAHGTASLRCRSKA